jgi:hypothetical protein
MRLDRGDFFHIVYRVQERLGKVFRELEPYALFPLDEYFTTHRQTALSNDPRYALKGERAQEERRLRFPIQRAA